MKKLFQVYYFLAHEGHTEFTLFAYLKKRFEDDFEMANIKFREITIPDVISNGKLNGVKDFDSFVEKYTKIKEEYGEETFLFFLDKDLYHSPQIGKEITKGGDLIQFIEYNSEFLILSLAGHQMRNLSEFIPDYKAFRDYCKAEFVSVYGKEIKYLINDEFLDEVFKNISEEDIKDKFSVIFDLCKREKWLYFRYFQL